jgi:hypothetical protein
MAAFSGKVCRRKLESIAQIDLCAVVKQHLT